jgi:predicted component of type VI protein secretion system
MGLSDRVAALTLIFEGRRFPVDKDRFTIGRKDADLTIRDANVARLHCFILRRGGQFVLVDAGSASTCGRRR